ncbi:MAG TPA: nitroreductase/quinone reductase family protein [Ktedonobacterales bacterium]|jgi:deazaflavin-dependent oxidoreductase (nitroreductase family)
MPQKMGYFSVMMYSLTGGRAYRGNADSPAGFLKLTTTGRKSGKQRTTTLLYIRDGADYVITASNAGKPQNPGWFHNVRSTPQVSIQAHGTQIPVTAEVADSEKRKALWARLVEISPMYAGYEKRVQREIPMVILHPASASPEKKAE